ncbi:MAG: hypothetical protein JNL83_21085 [Myxococcales bacterium]|nr:hypothetical protein [Myxococcales bacterium]
MSALLRAAIAERFETERIDATAEKVDATIVYEGAHYRATLAMRPHAAIAVALPSTDGFVLELQWADRHANAGGPRAPSFDDSFLIETNDLALATIWLDGTSRAALLASRYMSQTQAQRATALLLRDGQWRHEIAHDQVRAERRDAETSPERMGDMLLATLLIASRPVRWATRLQPIAKALAAEVAPRVEIGGKPMLRARRAAVDVSVSVARRLGPGDPGRLRTIVSAHRTGSGGETLSLIQDDLPRAAWPPPNPPGGLALTIDPRAGELLEIARPAACTVRPHDVDIAFDGALLDRDRLGSAIELAAHWAHEDYSAGPYR